MQCKCGGDTRISDSVNKKLKAALEFYECKACGRVSNARLFIDEVLVADDPFSRQHYAVLDKELADRLLSTALAEPESPVPVAPAAPVTPAPAPITTPLHQQDIEMFETGNLF